MPIANLGRNAARLLGAFLLVLAVAATARDARADEFIDRVNAAFKAIPEDKRSDLVLLPLLPAMDPPPAVLTSQTRAALFGNAGPGWQESKDWAQKPAQKAVLEALEKITKEEDRLKAFAFAQPYGVDAMGSDTKSIDLVTKGMYTELGEPPLLAAAQHKYMPALERVGILVQVEASRLLEAGDGAGALKLLTDWLFFARQMADRPFVKEKKWAMDSMRLTLMRIRDIIYQDMRAPKHTIELAKLRELVTRLRERRGFLMLDRLTLPEGDFIAYEQLLAKVMKPGGGPDPATFAPTMARVSATDRPLQLFSWSAYWDSARESQAGQRDYADMLKAIRGDWFKRWELSPFDRLMNTVTDYRRRVQTSPKFSILNEPFSDIDELFSLRQQLRTELGGTRMGAGAYGFLLRQKSLPKGLEATRPEFIDTIDKDPYSKQGIDLTYFVPVRDTTRPGEPQGQPFVMKLYPPDPNPTFEVPLGSDIFVIYSVGPDDVRGFARFATQTRTGIPGDYLLFPPPIALYRQRLLEQNQLK